MSASDVKKSKVRFPLRWQYTLTFASVMTVIILLTILFCSLFLPVFYEKEKIKVIRSAYHELTDAYESSLLDDGEYLKEKLDDLSMRNDISVVMINEESVIRYSSRSGERDLEMVLFGIILGVKRNIEAFEEIESTDSYSLNKITENGNTFLEMYGRIGDNYSFLMRTPMESIEASSYYASLLFLMIGIAGIVLGSIIIYFVSKRVSDPILRLSDISAKMVDLDFDARYGGSEKNEIGLLGNNINILSESLEESISDLKTANNELKRDIEKKTKAAKEHSEFISNVSHELKTPISLIRGYAEGLKEGMCEDAENRDYYLDVILDEADKMNHMVKDLLNLEQLESGENVIEMERFDIYEVIDNFLKTAGKLSDDIGAEVRFGEKKGNYVWGDPYMAETVFANYFSNAVHYCKETADGKYIGISSENRDKILRVCVFNTGDPIPEDVLPRIWDKFYKADKARTRQYGGSGVGLSIVKAAQRSIGMEYGVNNCDNGVMFWFEMESK